MENKQKIIRHLGTQKGANLCLKWIKYVRRPGSAQTRWGSLSTPQTPWKGREGYGRMLRWTFPRPCWHFLKRLLLSAHLPSGTGFLL